MWQNSNLLQLGGDTVDSDICYINFPSIIKSCGLNGFSSQPREPENDKKDVYYTVQKGDTLSGIAKKYNTTVSEIARKNDIKLIFLLIIF